MKTISCVGLLVCCVLVVSALPAPEDKETMTQLVEAAKPLTSEDVLEPQESRWGGGGWGGRRWGGWGGRGFGGYGGYGGWGRPRYGYGGGGFGFGGGYGYGGGWGR